MLRTLLAHEKTENRRRRKNRMRTRMQGRMRMRRHQWRGELRTYRKSDRLRKKVECAFDELHSTAAQTTKEGVTAHCQGESRGGG